MSDVTADTLRAKVVHILGDLDCQNLIVRGRILGVPKSPYRALAYRAGAGTVASGGFLAYNFDTIAYDPAVSMSTAGVYTCPLDGVYRMAARVGVVSTASGQELSVAIYATPPGGAAASSKRGVDLLSGGAIGNGLVVAAEEQYTRGTTLQVRVFTAVNGLAIETGRDLAYFAVSLVSAL